MGPELVLLVIAKKLATESKGEGIQAKGGLCSLVPALRLRIACFRVF